MATKITLGSRPKSFKSNVQFPMLDGTTGSISISYRYRTRREFGKFIDALLEAAGETPKLDDEKFSMAALMEKTAGNNADYILQVVEGWDVEADLTHENVQQLADELPAAVSAIMEQYRAAITDGKAKN
ncbi:MAG: phage tail assembly chaperone [Polaromonas sp.]